MKSLKKSLHMITSAWFEDWFRCRVRNLSPRPCYFLPSYFSNGLLSTDALQFQEDFVRGSPFYRVLRTASELGQHRGPQPVVASGNPQLNVAPRMVLNVNGKRSMGFQARMYITGLLKPYALSLRTPKPAARHQCTSHIRNIYRSISVF